MTQRYGGVELVNCTVIDDRPRPAIKAAERASDFGVHDITGTLTVHNPAGDGQADFGAKHANADVQIQRAPAR